MRLLHEPLVHFLLGGALILLLFSFFNDTPPRPVDNQLVVTDQDVSRLTARFEATWRRYPTEEELSHLVNQLVRQEVLVREAQALGLDQGDEIVRQRLVQKMMFLAEGSIAALDAADDILEAHIAAHPDRFQRPASVAFTQYLLRDGVDAAEAAALLSEDGDIEAIAAPTLLPGRFPLTPQTVIDRTFGAGFFDLLAGVEPGTWSGGIQSTYGPHVVYVERFEPAGFPDLQDVRDAVEQDWRALRQTELVEERIEALLARYEVVLPERMSGASP